MLRPDLDQAERLFLHRDRFCRAEPWHTPRVSARGRAGHGSTTRRRRRREEPTPTHQRKDRQDGLLGMTTRRSGDFGRRPPNREIVQQRKQVAVVDRHAGPGARSLEGHRVPLRTCERTRRESERPLGWALRLALGWRAHRDRRHEPASPTAQASREEPHAIQAKEQRRAACLAVAVRLAQSKAVVDLGLAAAGSCKEPEHVEFAGALDPGPAGGRAKEGSPVAWLDLYVWRERVGPQDRVRAHGRGTWSGG